MTILASGSNKFRIDDFYGDLPWSHLFLFQDFLIERITGKTVIIGSKSYKMDFFKKLIHQAYAYPIIISSDARFSQYSAQAKSFEDSIDFLKTNRVKEEVFVLGGTQVFETAISFVNKVEYFQMDANPNGTSNFPELLLRTNFRRVSICPLNEVARKTQNAKAETYRIEIQKWLRVSEASSST